VSSNGPGPGPGSETRSYHGQPVLKQPVWTWEIPLYFFAGGLAGASAGLAVLSEARGNQVMARRAWGASVGGIMVSPALLTSDLGKPSRFLNMLRMFKVTSPMSVGSWILTLGGGATTLAASNSLLGWFPRLGRVAKPAAAALGLPLCTYTGALVANTAIPVWHEARRELPFVFGAGAALSAGALGVILTPPEYAASARRLALIGAVAESGLKESMERRLGPHGQPYKQGPSAIAGNVSRVCLAAGAAILGLRGGRSRLAAAAGGVLLSAGALSARWSVFKAGFQSAADHRYVIGPQRAAIANGERQGAARRQARVS
jgi:hypothetical protein